MGNDSERINYFCNTFREAHSLWGTGTDNTNHYSALFDSDKVPQSVSTSFDNNAFGYRITGVSPEENN